MNIRKTILLAIAAVMLQAAVGCEEKKSEAGRLYTLTAAVPQKEGKLRLKKIKRRYVTLYIIIVISINESGKSCHRKPRFSVSTHWARRLPCAPLRGGGKG